MARKKLKNQTVIAKRKRDRKKADKIAQREKIRIARVGRSAHQFFALATMLAVPPR